MSSAETYKRNRGWLLSCIILCIFLGLLSRSHLPLFPVFREYGGDILWSAMFYFIFAYIRPSADQKHLFVITIAFSFLIEFSQLIQVSWLQTARQGILRYLLGQGFQMSDFVCYVIGVLLAFLVDFLLQKRCDHP